MKEGGRWFGGLHGHGIQGPGGLTWCRTYVTIDDMMNVPSEPLRVAVT